MSEPTNVLFGGGCRLNVLMGSLRRTYERDLKLARKKVTAQEEQKNRDKRAKAKKSKADATGDSDEKKDESATARRRDSVEKGRISDIAG
jgi:Sec-independent protein translocase protein TatA